MRYFIIVLLHFIALQCSAEEKCKINAPEREIIISQSLETFDADTELGWRKLAYRGCVKEAIDLLDEYRMQRGSSYRTSFHQAQLLLSLNDVMRAKPLLFQSLRSDLDKSNPFLWNQYVLGYIAFVDRDFESLKFYLSKLEGGNLNHGNKINSAILKKMVENFDRPYPEFIKGN